MILVMGELETEAGPRPCGLNSDNSKRGVDRWGSEWD